ncbi:large ribosomal subunit protein eL24 isoform X2 [Macrotis lagotis]|uniref:large ribosomal subunit protein eL24 isoform X2 n=1 Tax=Macrotis lagotis TaxID=92651 RepID=UPI003D69EDFB
MLWSPMLDNLLWKTSSAGAPPVPRPTRGGPRTGPSPAVPATMKPTGPTAAGARPDAIPLACLLHLTGSPGQGTTFPIQTKQAAAPERGAGRSPLGAVVQSRRSLPHNPGSYGAREDYSSQRAACPAAPVAKPN